MRPPGRTLPAPPWPAWPVPWMGWGVRHGHQLLPGAGGDLPLIQEMRSWTSKPIIVKPNAGLPDPATGPTIWTFGGSSPGRWSPLPPWGVSILGAVAAPPRSLLRRCPASPASEDQRPPSARGVLRQPDGGVCRCPGHRRAHQSHRQKALPAGPAGADFNYIMERAIEQAGRRCRHSGYQRGPAGAGRGGDDGPGGPGGPDVVDLPPADRLLGSGGH